MNWRLNTHLGIRHIADGGNQSAYEVLVKPGGYELSWRTKDGGISTLGTYETREAAQAAAEKHLKGGK